MPRWITPWLAGTVVLLMAGFLLTDVGNRAIIRRPPPPRPRVPTAIISLPDLPEEIDTEDTEDGGIYPATAAGLHAAMETRADALATCTGGADVVVAFTLRAFGDQAVISGTTAGDDVPSGVTSCVQHAVSDLVFAAPPDDALRLRYAIAP